MQPSSSDRPTFNHTRSEYAQRLLYLKGEPLNMDDYPMFRAIYDGDYDDLVLKTSRQVGKSTTLAAFGIIESICRPHFQSIFVTPTGEQTRRFSTLKVAKMLQYSPFVRKYYVGDRESNRVLLRMFTNGSELAFSYADEDADRVRGLTGDRVCFDRDAEILTRRGWLPVHELSRDDYVADVNDAGLVEWNRPYRIFRKHHTGEMVTFNHRYMRLRVTGDHNMWANYKVKTAPAYKTPDRYEFIKATDLAHTDRMGFKFTCGAVFPNNATAEITLPGVPGTYGNGKRPLTLPSEAFAELLGWYLSEGHLQWAYHSGETRKYPRIVITQNEGRYASLIADCLERCDLSYNITRRATVSKKNKIRSVRCTFVVNAPQLGQYARQFGKARNKFIPEELFDSPGLLPHVLKSLYLGDACYRAGLPWDQGVLRTRSRRLADDVHRAWVHLGRPAVIHTLMVPPNENSTPEPMYDVAAHQRNYYVFWKSEFETKKRVTIEEVIDEEVYCFTVKNHRPMVRGGFGMQPVISSQCLDECQDMLLEAVEPVVVSCMENSKFQYLMRCGTPKTMENPIETTWQNSTMSEWVIPCHKCNKWNAIRSEEYFGPQGPICIKCKNLINPREGQWLDFKPGHKRKGFHINRACMPEAVPICWPEGSKGHKEAVKQWGKVWDKLSGPDPWPLSKFRNEVIGVSDSIGRRIITLEQLRAMRVGPKIEHMINPQGNCKGIGKMAAGIDWSGGGSEYLSRTILSIIGMTAERKMRLVYYKIFPGLNPVEEVEQIARTLNQFSAHLAMVGCDAGEGNMPTDMLRKKFNPQRVTKFRYCASDYYIRWKEEGHYFSVNRTRAIDSMMMSLNRGEWEFPEEDHTIETIFEDILNEFEEVTREGNKVWRHAPTRPDDGLHSLNFARLAMQIAIGELDLTS